VPEARYWAVVPAAGAGRRRHAATPKQYLPLAGCALIAHTIERIAGVPAIAAVVVVTAPGDGWWPEVRAGLGIEILEAEGGAERCDSVLNGLAALRECAAADDWVLVHDAARPCVRRDDIERLMVQAGGKGCGGLLAAPLSDTIKRDDEDHCVAATIDRSGLWRALTPQMFRLQALESALRRARARGVAVTDEAQAMELAGAAPRLVRGHPDNIKVTTPDDLRLAELYLRMQAR